MAVKGDLAYQGLEELLQADLAASGGGRLTLRHGAHYAALYLDDEGLYVISPDLLEPTMLLDAFVARGVLDKDVLARLRTGESTPTQTLDRLVSEGVLDEAELLEVLAREVEDTVLDMLLWDQGAYRFEKEPFEPALLGLLGRICVDPVGVSQRARQRLEQRRAIGDRLGDHALLFEAIVGELPAQQEGGDCMHEVYARLDGHTVVHEMALQMGLSRFQVLDALARLSDAGLVRPLAAEALARAASDRADAGSHAVARAIVLQWAEMLPQDPSPLRKLASLAQDAGDKSAELEALCAQGSLFIDQGDHGQALEVFTRAMRHDPADEVVLAGLRVAAEAAGDSDALVDGTLLTAQTKLDEGEADAALEMIEPLLKSHPANMAVHLLRARALVHTEKRSEFFEQAEVVGQVLSRDGCHSDADREVVEFFRETIAHLAPDRGDLLERFRTIYDPRRRRRRAMALVGALVLVLCGTGVYFWPQSAGALLTRAHEAADAGDKDVALTMIRELVERYPDSDEAHEAYQLQARLFPPAPASTRGAKALAAIEAKVQSKLPAFSEALRLLPDQKAQAAVRAVLDPLHTVKAKPIRQKVLKPTAEGVLVHCARLHADVLNRVQVLANTAGAEERHVDDPIALRDFIDEAGRLRDAAWVADIKASSELLYEVAKLSGNRDLVTKSQELARASLGLDKAAAYYDEHIGRIRLTLAQRELDEADRRCREDAPKLMVAGQLDQADACYARLESLLERYAGDEVTGELVESFRRRQLPQLIDDRRAQIQDIRKRLAAAQAAEDKDDIDGAVAIYAALVKEYWLIRFENVCTLPLRVETTPPGARVFIDDHEVGQTPTTVRYAWGSDTKIRVEADGFLTTVHALRTAEDKPSGHMHLDMVPRPLWHAPTAGRRATRPLAIDGDVLICNRRGIVTRHAKADGSVLWTRDLSSLEGVRGRPALMGGLLHVPRVDGRVFLLDPATGDVHSDLKLSRPFGDPGALSSHVGIATAAGKLVLLRKGAVLRKETLEAVPTAGVVAAHHAFWVGTADGTIVRIDPVAGSKRIISCTRGTSPIVSMASSPQGLLATTSDGALLALDSDGDTLWKRASVGDLMGVPAQTAGVVATIDRAGTVHCFDAASGKPLRSIPSGGRSTHGILGIQGTLVVLLADGRLRAYDAKSGDKLLSIQVADAAPFPPAAVGTEHVVLPYASGQLGLIPAPRKR